MSHPQLRDQLIELDRRHLWHPYTPMSEYLSGDGPLVIDHAVGARLYDINGRSYLDGNASWWTALLGHNHPRLVSALREQSERLCHTSLAGITHEPAARLAAALVQVAPEGLSRVFFSDDGSTAVEVAIKLALQYHHQNGQAQRQRFVALDGAFHGETLGVTALGGVEVFRRPFAGVTMECVHVPSAADGYHHAFSALATLLESEGQEIAALVLEPVVQGAAGMRTYAPDYLRSAYELCQRHGVLLVADEVFTGYGRTGPMWACDHAKITPDILCTAKGFSGGLLPMAATLVTERLFEGFLGDKSRAFLYGHTFCGNPLGAAVARAVLEVYADEQILENLQPKAERIARCFAELGQLEGVTASRSLGMIGALDLAGESGYLANAGWQVYQRALELGAVLRPLGNVVYITPPLNIPDVDLADLLTIVEESVRWALSR